MAISFPTFNHDDAKSGCPTFRSLASQPLGGSFQTITCFSPVVAAVAMKRLNAPNFGPSKGRLYSFVLWALRPLNYLPLLSSS